MSSFANSQNTFTLLWTLLTALVEGPFNPLFCASFLLQALQNVIGTNFVTTPLTELQLRSLLYAKLNANVNNGTIGATVNLLAQLLTPFLIFRIRLGIDSVDVSYTAIAYPGQTKNNQGFVYLNTEEFKTFWDLATTAGIYIEVRQGPSNYFAFFEDPGGLGFATTGTGSEVLVSVPPYFGFFEDPVATGFSTIEFPLVGGNFCFFAPSEDAGGCFVSVIY